MAFEEFEEIEAWQEARTLVQEIYAICSQSELSKGYGLANQLTRAGVSVMSNIAEGFERKGNKEFVQYLFTAKASCAEVRSQLYVALDNGYIEQEKFDNLQKLGRKVARKIGGLIKYLAKDLE